MAEAELVDLRPLKRKVSLRLEPGDPVREAILGEPDILPRSKALPLLAVYAKVLMAPRRSPS